MCIQSLPNNTLYRPFTSTTKKAVGTVFLPTISSFDTIPLASVGSEQHVVLSFHVNYKESGRHGFSSHH
jgi:hypothetical protein